MVSAASTTATHPCPARPDPHHWPSLGRAVHTCSPVLLLIVARVLWTARPPARPALGAEATMAAPVGPMTFRCPLAVRSTCPPARCTAATISLASLERQRLGVACFFKAMSGDPQHPRHFHGPILGSRASGSQALRHRTAPLNDELGASSRAPGRRTRARTDPTWAALGPR